jgi:hypothetical protein
LADSDHTDKGNSRSHKPGHSLKGRRGPYSSLAAKIASGLGDNFVRLLKERAGKREERQLQKLFGGLMIDPLIRYRSAVELAVKLIDCSSFPLTREEADALYSDSWFHKNICTRDKLAELLKKPLRRHRILFKRQFLRAEQ